MNEIKKTFFVNEIGPPGEQGIQGVRGAPGEVGQQGERGEVLLLYTLSSSHFVHNTILF